MGTATLQADPWQAIDMLSGECWLWTRALWRNGYGKVKVNGRVTYAHRFLYELCVGPIPKGLELDHLCRNHACVNPEHLEPVTPTVNNRRGLRGVLKATCAQGHAWIEENIYVRPNDGVRKCHICQLECNRRAYQRRKRAA
jgi:hypothetical protein